MKTGRVVGIPRCGPEPRAWYGYVRENGARHDYFFHSSAALEPLVEGDVVEFALVESRSGRTKACNVRKLILP
jgi:cold shock CspA family protein